MIKFNLTSGQREKVAKQLPEGFIDDHSEYVVIAQIVCDEGGVPGCVKAKLLTDDVAVKANEYVNKLLREQKNKGGTIDVLENHTAQGRR